MSGFFCRGCGEESKLLCCEHCHAPYHMTAKSIDDLESHLEMLRFADAWQAVGMAATGRGIGEKAWRVMTCEKLGIQTDQRLMTGAEFIGALAKIGEGVEWLDDEDDE
jgi:hypothetical protein